MQISQTVMVQQDPFFFPLKKKRGGVKTEFPFRKRATTVQRWCKEREKEGVDQERKVKSLALFMMVNL